MSLTDFMTNPARACNGRDTNLFYSDSTLTQAVAIAICRTCPTGIRAACNQWADTTREAWGVWGGRVRRTPNTQHPRKTRQASASERAEHVKQIRELWAQGLSDAAIADRTGLGIRNIAYTRSELGLPALYGPGGRPLHPELVTA